MSRPRRPEFYRTPEWATRILIQRHIGWTDGNATILEPCAGDGAISKALRAAGCNVIENDIDPDFGHPYTLDVSKRRFFESLPPCDWVVTNPPFTSASRILQNAYDHAGRGVAMLLRLSFLEPCKDRGDWLALNPPMELIVLPRISFTGDGRHDSVTCAWMVWKKVGTQEQRIEIITGGV